MTRVCPGWDGKHQERIVLGYSHDKLGQISTGMCPECEAHMSGLVDQIVQQRMPEPVMLDRRRGR